MVKDVSAMLACQHVLSMTVLGAAQQEERSTRFETDFGETAAEASTAAADHGRAPVPTLSLQDIDAAIDREMASPQVSSLTVSWAILNQSSSEVCFRLQSNIDQRLWMRLEALKKFSRAGEWAVTGQPSCVCARPSFTSISQAAACSISQVQVAKQNTFLKLHEHEAEIHMIASRCTYQSCCCKADPFKLSTYMKRQVFGAGPVKVQIVHAVLWAAHKTRRAANPPIRPGVASLVGSRGHHVSGISIGIECTLQHLASCVVPACSAAMSRSALCSTEHVRMHILPCYWQS